MAVTVTVSILVAAVLGACSATDPSPKEAAVASYALDLSTVTTQTSFNCFRINKYSVVFLRAYAGAFDGTVVQNVRNANSASLGTEVYMYPNPQSAMSGSQQFQDMYGKLAANFDVKAIWIQVTSPILWSASVVNNTRFINDIIAAARTNGVTVGIYTNAYDWQQITNNWNGAGDCRLWYWNVLGAGALAETSSDFSDFHSFGPWNTAVVKQFGQSEDICGATVNRDVVAVSSNLASRTKLELNAKRPVIGGYV